MFFLQPADYIYYIHTVDTDYMYSSYSNSRGSWLRYRTVVVLNACTCPHYTVYNGVYHSGDNI